MPTLEELQRLSKDASYWLANDKGAMNALMILQHKIAQNEPLAQTQIDGLERIKRKLNMARLEAFRPKDIDFDHWRR